MTPSQWELLWGSSLAAIGTALAIAAIGLLLLPLPLMLLAAVLIKLRLWPVGFSVYLQRLCLWTCMLLVPAMAMWIWKSQPLSAERQWMVLLMGMMGGWAVFSLVRGLASSDDRDCRASFWLGTFGAACSAGLLLACFFSPEANRVTVQVPAWVMKHLVKEETRR